MHRLITGVALIAMAAAPTLADAGWGDVKGRFVLDGDAGDPAAVNVNKDTEYCGKFGLKEETIEVGEGNGLGNVFVYLYLRRGKSVDIHPDLADPGEAAVLDNLHCRFEPHALLVRTGQKLEVRNSDPGIGHNTNAQALVANPKFNTMVTNDSPEVFEFSKSEPVPQQVACNIHPWMKGYLLIRDNPYMAVTDKDGNFEIKGVPEGDHQFVIWHEGPGNLKNLKTDAGKTDRRGRLKVTVAADGTVDLGEVKVAASSLK